jgi:flagellar biosynthesis protein FlhB
VLTQAISFALTLLVVAFGAGYMWRWLKDLMTLIGVAASQRAQDQPVWWATAWMIDGLVVAAIVVLAAGAAGGIFGTLLQVRGVFSMDPIKPKFERLNPGENLKNLFSTRQLTELALSLIKVGVLGGVLYVLLRGQIGELFAAGRQSVPVLAPVAGRILLIMALATLAVSLLVAVLDYGHQKFEFLKQQRMSKQEVRQEHKDIEGDPYIKAHRMQFHRQLAQAPVQRRVERASVVLTNPTHVAVGLRYESGEGGVPRVVVKGADAEALEIRRIAAQLDVPVVESPPLARRLYERLDEEDFIDAEFFDAVAIILVEVERCAASRPRA